MPEHLGQCACPFAHASSGELLDACSSRGSATPHSWLDGLKPRVFLNQISTYMVSKIMTMSHFGGSVLLQSPKHLEATYSFLIFVRTSQQ